MSALAALDELVEAIYDAALDSAAWPAAVDLLRRRFRSVTEAFYFHDGTRKAVHPIHNGGIAPAYVKAYAELAAAPDYPWNRAEPLRRLGMLRTEARLIAHTGDPHAMRDTTYFNHWMRPQGLDHSIGITLLEEGGLSAKMTLLRTADDSGFAGSEERDFLRLAAHMQRALSVSRRLDLLLASQAASFATLDRMPYGVLLLEPDGAIAYVNAAGQAWLDARDGLRCLDGRVVAADPRDAARLEALLHATIQAATPTNSMALRRTGGRRLVLSAMRLSAERRLLVTSQAAAMLLMVDPDMVQGNDVDLVRRLYRLTEAEARLVRELLAGHSLHQAAAASGIAYETARWHLKALFQKTDTNRQAELIARLMRDIAAVPLV
jgi:DNA-binding CsgD family transcriptional regulator